VSGNQIGALFMMASMACFTLNDTFMKVTDGAIPLFQLLFLRGILTTILIVVLALWLKSLHFNIARRDWKLILMRSAAEMATAYFFITALFNMPLANVTATLQALPLTVTLGGALFFREAVGWRRMSAILIGFLGMLLIVRPGSDGFNVYGVYALLAVLGVTVRDLVTRQLSADVPSMTVTLAASLTVMMFSGIASATTPWVAINGMHALMIVGSSICIFGGYYLSVRVMRVGEISFTAPFRYTGLIWALILGWFVFGDWPSNLTLLGAGIVVATGLFTLYRERAVKEG
jgi:S-adenosylmethionine uptake transporter